MQLSLLLTLFLVPLTLGSPSDVLYIEKLTVDEGQILDAKDDSKLADIFTKNVTYNYGRPPNLYGVDSVINILAKLIPPETITQDAVTTQSITLLPPFDEQGAAGTAAGVVYTTVSYIGQGNLTGQALIIFGKYEDKYIKTGGYSRYGGWRISERLFRSIGKPVGNPEILPSNVRYELLNLS
ncbi:hypothetical protein MMC07_001494 [Pseudocyphellaria aurata]|nr:hypothetical protein [Pseudocyphellaria aurata]